MTRNPLMEAVEQAARTSRQRSRIAALAQHLDRVPADYAEGLAMYRQMIERYHGAVQALDAETAVKVQEAARALVEVLNGEDARMYLRHPEGAWQRLIDDTAAPAHGIPKWGQSGSFVVELDVAQGFVAQACLVRVEWNGMLEAYGSSIFPGFAAHAVDADRPFISDTGYRSFLGCHVEIPQGATTVDCARAMLRTYLQKDLRGQLVPIDPRWRRAA